MEDLQSGTLSTVCQACTALDCWECDYAQLRWGLPERERLICAKRLKEKAIARYQRQIAEIAGSWKDLRISIHVFCADRETKRLQMRTIYKIILKSFFGSYILFSPISAEAAETEINYIRRLSL